MAKGKWVDPTGEATTDTLRFVEFETAADLKTAVDKLDNKDFKGSNVHCISDVWIVLL